MERLNGYSLDIQKQNIEKIKEIFPEAVEEGNINFEVLKDFLGGGTDTSREKYQFTWNGKSQSIKLAQTPSSATLRPCKDKSKNWNTTENLYIEGDNLEVLKQLQKTYYGKIRMIYIDPPYNTGNDFVYHDDFRNSLNSYTEQTNQSASSNPESNGRFHTDWLNMMYPRLILAKNLLTDDGVIFTSIDDNEVDNLKKIMNEIFGESNFLGDFIINSTPNARDYGHIGKMHEFCLFYAKNSNMTNTNMLPEEGKTYKYTDEISGFNIHPLYNSNEAFTNLNRPNLYYPFYVYPDKKIANGFYEIGLEKKSNSIEVYPPKSVKNNVQFVWRWGKEKSMENLNKEIIGYKMGDEYRIVQKMRHDKKIIRSLLLDTKYSSRRGTAEVEEILHNKIFSFPKPLSLIYDFVKIATDENSVILDFFSGSATTAHAVMKLNAEDGGNRKFIMVQLPELCDEKSEAHKAGYKTICEIGEERIRRAGEQIKSEWGKEHPRDTLLSDEEKFTTDIGFKVFKLDSSNVNEWDSSLELDEKELSARLGEVFKHDRSKEDILYEIMLKYGVFDRQVEEIEVNGKTMYRVGKRYMIVCLENDVTGEDVKAIGELSPKTVIFKESGFTDDNAKINAVYNLEHIGVEDIKCI